MMMRSTKRTMCNVEKLKTKLHKELTLRYKEFFESTLAVELLQHEKGFTSVEKISAAIMRLMSINKGIVIERIAHDPKILAELTEPYFGSCYTVEENVTSSGIFEKMYMVLNEGVDLQSIMQIHCIFIHRLYDHLETKNEKAEWVAKIFSDTLFNNQDTSRIENQSEKKPTTQLGFSTHRVFSSMLNKSDKQHLRAVDKFSLNSHSSFVHSAEEHLIPLVCGPSGHTGSLMLGAKLYGDLTSEQLQEYALVCFAFLAAGGNHSFHEVMVVAAQVGVNVKMNNYDIGIVPSITESLNIAKVSKRFPEYLNTDHFKGVSYVKNS